MWGSTSDYASHQSRRGRSVHRPRPHEAMRHTPDGREQFVSGELVPLRDVQTREDAGQTVIFDFLDECEGMCGV